MERKSTFAVVVPAYNEELVIEGSLNSLIKEIDKKHVYVVSDGSIDRTAEYARKIVPNILTLHANFGKALALKKLITRFQLTKRYRYIMFFDADTKLQKGYFTHIKNMLRQEKAAPACVVGTVSSRRKKLISAYRVFEYGFSHRLFKSAQHAMGTIVIAPGCTSVYRASVLDELDFGGGTLTEDFDLTLQIHEKKLGKIIYCPKARVITQDPSTFRDYWRQISRWNTGYWQNFFRHRLYLPKNKVNLEVLLLTGDFLYWLALISFAVLRPLFLLKIYGLALLLMWVISVVVIGIERQYWALPYTPLFGVFQMANLTSFIHSFFLAIFGKKGSTRLAWNKPPRYSQS